MADWATRWMVLLLGLFWLGKEITGATGLQPILIYAGMMLLLALVYLMGCVVGE